MSSNTKQKSSQADLSEIDYEDHIKEKPSSDEIIKSIDKPDDFYDNITVGDTLWLNGTKYIIVDSEYSLFGPTPYIATAATGSSGTLIAGTLSENTMSGGFTWARRMEQLNEDEQPSRSHLLSKFEDAYLIEGDKSKMYEWARTTDERSCPECEENEGKAISTTLTDESSIEIRYCRECSQVYKYSHSLPTDSSATILTLDEESETIHQSEITGAFKQVRQDTFKFPLDTNKGRDEGVVSAEDVATYVNSRILPDPYNTLISNNPDNERIKEHLKTELDPDSAITILEEYTTENIEKPPTRTDSDGETSVIPDSQLTTACIEQIMSCLDKMSLYEVLQLIDFEPFGVVGYEPDGYRNYRITTHGIDGVSEQSPAVYWESEKHGPPLTVAFYHLPQNLTH